MKTSYLHPIAVGFAFLLFIAAPVVRAQHAAKAKDSASFAGLWLTRGGFQSYPQSQWSAEMLPFTPKGLALFQANKPGKGPRGVRAPIENDPLTKSNPAGLYRTLVYFRGFEFIQAPGKLIQVFELGKNWRAIYTDGRPVPDEVAGGPYWYGYSVGRWEGDTLVVTTVDLDERAWLDEWGTPFSGDARVEERWQRLAPDKLQLKITVYDPAIYTRSWTSRPVTYTLQHDELGEIIYAPIDEANFNERVRTPVDSPKK